ncbi:unnamed protein product [Peronospora farinosa]|uniref:Uncharacterized protein n=1 Tax=Peronospora farinosa TaxID=134698 RepID=A0AAV0THS7_9STRA|nr:unnamed protein product [Peronospora farinosa]CAI5722185.1 unnamed protein product [Peronospora farinosa]
MDGLEDNIVGSLFLQHGEDNGYNPEDFIQEINVGALTPHFRISVADDDGGIPGSLFACAVWNGARFIAIHFARYPNLVKGRTVVEFGAASALPSLVALHFGAKMAVMTDYPNELLLKNIASNIHRNESLLGNGRHEVCGHLWGSDTAGLLRCLDESQCVKTSMSEGVDLRRMDVKTRFDVAVVAECLWLHHLHEDLLKSIDSCLTPCGKAFVSFAHHVPGHEQNDLSFFTKAKKLYGFNAVHLDTLASPHVFNADLIVDQYLYVLTRSNENSSN